MSAKYILLLVTCWFFTVVTYAQGDGGRGKLKSAICASCHGQDGNTPVNSQWPKIAGQNETYFIKQLLNYRQGEKDGRNHPIMTAIAAKLSFQDMEDLAVYYSTQPRQIGAVLPQYVKHGESLYRGGDLKRGIPACMSCHDPQGLGNLAAGFPVLSGQNPAYVASQLKAFQKTIRHNDINHMMRDIAGRLTDEDIAALASYVNGLY